MQMRVKRKLWRRIARAFAITLASVLALAALALAFLHTPWGKDIVRGRIENKLAAKVNGRVKLGSLDYTFLFGAIQLRDLEIADAAGRPAIRIAAIDVDLDRSSVLAKQPLLEELAVRGLAVSVIESPDGRSNLTGLFKPSQDKPSLARLRVARLTIDGRATVTKPDGTAIAIDDLRVAGSLEARLVARELDASLARLGAKVSIAKPGRAVRRIDVGVGALTLARGPAALDVRVSEVAAGPLSIEAARAHAGLANGRLHGAQLVSLQRARIDRAKLAALLGRELLRDDVAIDVTIDGPADRLVLDGSVRTGSTCLDLDGTADLAAARPRYQVTLVGDDLRSNAVLTRKPLPAITTDVRVALTGAGTSLADLEAELELAISALGVDVTSKASVAGKTLHGTLSLGTQPARALAAIEAAGIALPAKVKAMRGQLPPSVELAVTADGRLDGELAVTLSPTTLALAKGTVSLAGTALLDHGKLRRAGAQIRLAALELAALAQLAGRTPKLDGTLSGRVDVTREGTHKRADYDLSLALARPALVVGARGSVDPTQATARLNIAKGTVAIATADARLPLGTQANGKLGLRPSGAWQVAVELARRPAAELASLVPATLRAKLPRGDVELHVELAGTPARPTGTIALAATHDAKRVDLHGTVASSPQGITVATKASVSLAVAGAVNAGPPKQTHASTLHGFFTTKPSAAGAREQLARVDATIALPAPFATGTLDIEALRAGATVDASIDIPERTLASLGALRPQLGSLGRKLGGKLDGRITAKGGLAQLALDARLRWFGYRTAAGTIGETTLVAYGSPTALTAKVAHGDTLALVARIDRSGANRIAVHASAHAVESPLLPLLPAYLAGKLGAHDPGRVRSNLDGTFALVRGPAGLALDAVDVTGALEINGASLAIPASGRRYHDIGLTLAADPRGLRISSHAHERDAENSQRRLDVTGLLAFANHLPHKLDLSLVAHDWLLFGSSSASKLGAADAPRAAADFDIGVAVDLASPIIGVDATVRSLALRAPERFDRGHQPELASDDIIFLERGATPGKLPVARPVSAAAPAQRRPIDIRIHIPDPIRLNQTPFDVMAHGELAVTVRDTGVTTRGALTMDRGSLYLFGHDHALVAGSLRFTDEHPHGWLALTFERPLPDAVMRELSKTSANGGARVSFAGAPTTPKTSLAGAANAALAEVMAMHNAGRGVYETRPGLPASASVQAPRGDQLSVLTFLASNLPHLMFLDRISAWSDPYASANAYGRIQHVEAERYTRGDRSRIRAVVRPATPGRSSAELQYDRMLLHHDRAAVGVGVRAGDRGGGGVGVFLEWSSDD